MSHYHSYLNSAKEILSVYAGEEPFSSFIKKYFARYKKYGSKDRKQIIHLCYCYFRLGKSELPLSIEEKILAGLFICSDAPNEILQQLKPIWNEKAGLSMEEKSSLLTESYRGLMLNVFPWKEELSNGIDHEKFAGSFFIQPDLFLRLRPGKENIVKQKLEKAGITFNAIKNDCIALSNSIKLDEVIELNKEAVVQDYSSQSVGEFLLLVRRRPSDKVWDCCAASGGKSIMAKDILGNINLTVSDIRESILTNLKKRFEKAGINHYKYFVNDLTKKSSKALPLGSGEGFGLIICDAPCTGSGTWSRTPEQLYYFDKKEIVKYSSLQKQIVSNTIPHLQPGGYFLYITCSVFKKENEEVVEFMVKNFGFDLIRMELLKGYDKKADTMFAALFKKPV